MPLIQGFQLTLIPKTQIELAFGDVEALDLPPVEVPLAQEVVALLGPVDVRELDPNVAV